MDDFSTTHHVPGAFPETRIALPQKRERTTALPQIFVTPSSSSRPLDAPARSHMQNIEPPSSQGVVQFGESNDDIPLPIYPVASRHEDCPTTQTMDFSLKATSYFDGKLGTTRADVGAVSDDCVDQPAVNAPSVQDHHDPRGNTSQDCASCSSLKTQNTMLKQLVEEVQAESDEALSSVESLQGWLSQARRDAGLDVHGQDLEMAVENHTAHLPIDIQYHAARNRKIRTLEANVADLTEQLHNVCRYYNMLMDEVKASSGIASTAPSARNAITPTISPPYDLSDTAATLFALPPHSDIDARIGELQSALYNEATFHGQARVQFEEMAKSARKMAAAEAEERPISEEKYKIMVSQIERLKYERLCSIVADLQSTEEQIQEQIQEQIKTFDQKLNASSTIDSSMPPKDSLNRLCISAGYLEGYLYDLRKLRLDFSMVATDPTYETIKARLKVLQENVSREAERLRHAWVTLMTTETQSPVAIDLEDEKPISNYAAILEHSHQYQTTMAVEEPENN
ncbi:hypothetical protein D6D13_08796 [Aureobasidium pullulans]|uniref:Uncharacterized protein n=1 Tax=Aureobasidium pullulans TaxID=5580 RepID=A0A4S9C520_AURPU|nr:hypothetical protein D6D13_08796 [Aureobasidium pullulans]